MDFQKLLVNTKSTMQEVIQVMDAAGQGLALVVSDNNALLGIVTDGDLRRALLNQCGMTSLVSEFMNTTPKTMGSHASRAEIQDFMDKNSIIHIPLTDKNNILTGIETHKSIIAVSSRSNPVFIMAGGFGTRLSPLTDNCPKPLLKVGDKPILEIILNKFIKHGFSNFYFSTHYMPEMIEAHFGNGEDWNVSIKYIHEETPLGTAGALGLLPQGELKEPLIIMNGDLLTELDFSNLLDFHLSHRDLATVCTREYNYRVPFGVVEHQDGIIKNITEKPNQNFYVSAGIYVLDPQIVSKIKANQRIDMPELINNEINSERPTHMFPIHEYWLDIGQKQDFQVAQEYFRKE